MKKKRILSFVGYYLPGYKAGGVLRTLSNSVNALEKTHEFYIITRDHDLGDQEPYQNIKPGEWNQIGPAKVFFLPKSSINLHGLYNIINSIDFDIYLFNSFFDINFTLLPFIMRFFYLSKKAPVLLAPRGEFTSSSLREKTRLKKFLTKSFDLLGFPKKLTWLASSEQEAQQIRSFFNIPFDGVRIAPDIPSTTDRTTSYEDNSCDSLKVISLSRIHPTKGTLEAFKAILGTTQKIEFNVYGPIEDQEYWSKCIEISNEFKDNVVFNYFGPIESGMVHQKFSENDLFLFPSPGENYGHVIAEAFSAKVIVLTSDKTPWSGFKEQGVGDIIPVHEISLYSQRLDEFAKLPKEELIQIKKLIGEKYKQLINIDHSIIENIKAIIHAENRYIKKTSGHTYQECVNCVMDTTDPLIRFNEYGLCDGCDNFYKLIEPRWKNSDSSISELQSKIKEIKKNGKNKKYDCIIGVSGGLDSSYLVYCAVKKLKLRPLLFHCDAGWNTAQAVWNINCLVKNLDLDLYTHVIDWQEMRELQLAFLHSQIPDQDLPQDGAFFSALYNYAIKNNFQYVLTGANFSTECSREPQSWGGYPGIDKRLFLDIMNRFGGVKLKNFPLIDLLTYKVFYRVLYRMQIVRPLNHLKYTKKEAEKTLQSEIGWKPFAHKHHESRFTRFYEDYWMPQKFGYDRRKSHFSSLILTGQMSKTEAIKNLQKPFLQGPNLEQEFQYVARKLEISPEELRKIFRHKNQTFHNYKNKYSFIILGSRILRALGLEKRKFR